MTELVQYSLYGKGHMQFYVATYNIYNICAW